MASTAGPEGDAPAPGPLARSSATEMARELDGLLSDTPALKGDAPARAGVSADPGPAGLCFGMAQTVWSPAAGCCIMRSKWTHQARSAEAYLVPVVASR
mmetsp:Transcript_2737/g.7662  ORF Transcript_2737/g.7662 Transcript_2737/m.7662 type:complete len:99 (-) Transcript_2737:461-757(-)